MAKVRPPELPLAAIRDMLRWFKAAKVRGVVIGGVAVTLQGYARSTRDLDALVVIDHSALPAFVAGAEEFGFTARVPDPVAFARELRMLLLRHEPTALPLDISLGALEFEERLIERASLIKIRRVNIPVASPEDLIILKAIANRPQDIADVDHLLTANPHVDRSYIRRRLSGFSEILDRPDILDQVETLLALHENRRRR